MSDIVDGAEIENLPLPWEAAKQSLVTTRRDTPSIAKAAIILTAIGPEVAAKFLKGMDEEYLTKTAGAISALKRIAPEVLDSVIAEFLLSIGTEEEIAGGVDTARRLLMAVLDKSMVDKIMFDVEGGDTRKAWKKMNDTPIVPLANFIGMEHVQTAAVILSELRADKAAAVLERLEPELAQLAVLRLSRVPSLDRRVSDLVERVIARDFLSALQRTTKSRKPADVIAALMNNLSSDTRELFIAHLEEQKPQLAKEVLRVMFTFADIRYRVSARDIASVIKTVDEAVLLPALKSAMAAKISSAEFIMDNIPKRLGERLVEELEEMQEVSARDGEAAQQEVVRVIQEMVKLDKIVLVQEEIADE